MVCPQCKAKTKDNQPCKRHTCKFAPKCYQHTSVAVAPSQMPNAGRGLFAKKPIRKGEIVADYTFAPKISRAAYDAKRLAGTATHIAMIKGDYYDASDVSTTVAGMANRAPSGGRNNLRLTKTGKLQAQRSIAQGRELLLAYGRAYAM